VPWIWWIGNKEPWMDVVMFYAYSARNQKFSLLHNWA